MMIMVMETIIITRRVHIILLRTTTILKITTKRKPAVTLQYNIYSNHHHHSIKIPITRTTIVDQGQTTTPSSKTTITLLNISNSNN